MKLENKTYDCRITLHSGIGNTPLTNRGGLYRDKLLQTIIQVVSPDDARQKCIELINTTTHAMTGFWYAPDMPEGPTSSFESGGLFGCAWRKKLHQTGSKYGPMQNGIDERSIAGEANA